MPVPSLPNSAYSLSFAGPSAFEQLMLELMNRARMDPTGEVGRVGTQAGRLANGISSTGVQPLAIIPVLDALAQAHSDDMLARNYFDHNTPEGDSPFDRMRDGGYNYTLAGENLSWIGSWSNGYTFARIRDHHENLWESDGHQRNLMNPGFSEVGIGFAVGAYTYQGSTYPNSSMITQKFGDRGLAYLTGVVIDDADDDGFYDIGEGQGAVRITVWNASGAFATSTWGAGGYSLALAPGTYTVRFEGGDLDGVFQRQVTIGQDNVKLDVFENLLPSPSGSDPAPAPAPAPASDEPVRVDLTSGNDRYVGGAIAEKIIAKAGHDVVFAGGGNDIIAGGGGHDRVYGGAGNDRLVTSGGNDRGLGGGGNDVLAGGGGNDRLYGQAGDDRILGQGGNDILVGGTGGDNFIFGGRFGFDRVVDFDVSEDTLTLVGFADGFDPANRASVVNGDLVLDLGIGEIVLDGVTDVSEVDFVLV